MHILVDGYNLARAEGTGVATYGRSFISAVQALNHDVSILMGVELRRAKLESASAEALCLHHGVLPLVWRFRRIGGSALAPFGYDAYCIGEPQRHSQDDRLPQGSAIWNSYGLFAHAIGAFRKLNVFSTVRVPGVQIAHWTYPLPLRIENAINIYTFHDLVPLLRPDLTLENRRNYLRLCRAVALRADHLVTVSDSSRVDIIEHLGIAPERVTTTYQSHTITASDIQCAESSVERVTRELGLRRGKYFVFAGAVEPKKNLPMLLKAYFRSGVTTPLILVGSKGWDIERQLAPLNEQSEQVAERVRVLGYQSRSNLLAIIRGAKATFFPSLAEGFGLPAIESMALGTPVLASQAGGLAEVTGNAAAIVNPHDVADMAEAIRMLDWNADHRTALVRAGLKQAETFSMAAYRTRLSDLFASLLAKRQVHR